jgi:peroxiredoxin Q/BCP
MPRKTNAEGEEPVPRRSTRISSQSTPGQEQAKPAAKTKAAAKRSADDDNEQSSSKKAKAEDAAEDADAEPVPVIAPIDVGDSLPSLTLQNEKNESIDVSTLTAEKGVVLFLVPKADTPGCTNQACGFRDIYPDFTSVNYEVYCLSADSPTAQSKWQTKKELPYPLLSDPKRLLIGALGAADGAKTKRSHFVFAKGGELLDKKMPVKPVESPKLALEFIKSLSEN